MNENAKKTPIKSDYMTPGEIIKKNPFLENIWTAGDIGYLLRMKLVHGKKFNRGCWVSESEVIELFRWKISGIPPAVTR